MAVYSAATQPSGGGSSSSSSSSSLMNMITSTILPPQQQPSSSAPVGVSPAMSNSLQRHPVSLSLSRAALGWTTTVAMSLLMLQWLGNKNRKKTTPLDWITRMLSSFFWKSEEPVTTPLAKDGEKKADNMEGSTVVLHRGSCHCGSITFKLTPARQVRVVQSPHSGKLQYPTARVPSDQLQLISGKHLWNTYHVQSEGGDVWAYSFCKQCAIHLLHATDADQSSLFVNLQCFNVVDKAKTTETTPNFVPIPTAAHINSNNTDGEDSVAGKNSVISTVTAATQKSFLTTVTALPDYANPRTFGQQQQQQQMRKFSSASDSGSESGGGIVLDDPPRPRRRNLLPPTTTPRLRKDRVQKQIETSLNLPSGVVAYPQPSTTRSSPYSGQKAPPSPFEQPIAPTASWPLQQPGGGGNDADDEDDDASISSHSAASRQDMDYPSTSTTEVNTASSTAANSSASSAVAAGALDYSVTVNRERMLHNMRKHLKVSPSKRA